MKRPRIRALVLTAGFGTRLRPLTCFVPKPLLPIAGEPLVGNTLQQLAALGCEVAVLNLHHLANQIPRTLGQIYHGMPLLYSEEEPIQGTLGALVPPREILQDADVVLLVNGDSLCRWPWRALLKRHFKSQADVTLLLHRQSPDEALGGGVALDASGRIVQIRQMDPLGPVKSRHVFAGVHLISPRLLERLEAGPGDIIADFYIPLLQEGRSLVGCVTGRHWQDLGTPDRYMAACLEHTKQPWWKLGRRRNRISPLSYVADSAEVTASIVEATARIEDGAQIQGSIVLAGAQIRSGCVIQDSIIGPGVVLPASTGIERRMIHRTLTGYQPSENETVLGDLIYTPLN